jgi:hypothetical protein
MMGSAEILFDAIEKMCTEPARVLEQSAQKNLKSLQVIDRLL